MIFSAPKIQWLQVFYTLNNPGNSDLCGIVVSALDYLLHGSDSCQIFN